MVLRAKFGVGGTNGVAVHRSHTYIHGPYINYTVDFGYKEHLGPGESVPYNRLFPISEVHTSSMADRNSRIRLLQLGIIVQDSHFV